MQTFCKTLFPVVEYAYSTIPTYPSGQIGYMLCSKNPVSVLAIFHSASTTQLIVVRLPLWTELTYCKTTSAAQELVSCFLVTGTTDMLFLFFFESGNKFQRTSESTFNRRNAKYEPQILQPWNPQSIIRPPWVCKKGKRCRKLFISDLHVICAWLQFKTVKDLLLYTQCLFDHWQVLNEAWPAPTDHHVYSLPDPQTTNKNLVLWLLHLLIIFHHHWRFLSVEAINNLVVGTWLVMQGTCWGLTCSKCSFFWRNF